MSHEEATRWMGLAACRGAPRDLWIPDDENRNRGRRKGTASYRNPYAEAKAVCDRCLVSEECLAYALELDISVGMFGGTTPETRAKMQRGAERGTHPNDQA